MKISFWDPKNLVTTFKAIAVNIVSSAILFIPLALAYWLINTKSMNVLGRLIQISCIVIMLWLWGFIANKFWGWK